MILFFFFIHSYTCRDVNQYFVVVALFFVSLYNCIIHHYIPSPAIKKKKKKKVAPFSFLFPPVFRCSFVFLMQAPRITI